MYLWVVVINEVQVDPQLPHTLKGISEPQTGKNKTSGSAEMQFGAILTLLLTLCFQSTNRDIYITSRRLSLSTKRFS